MAVAGKGYKTGGGKIIFSWEEPSLTGGSDIQSYEIPFRTEDGVIYTNSKKTVPLVKNLISEERRPEIFSLDITGEGNSDVVNKFNPESFGYKRKKVDASDQRIHAEFVLND